MRVITGSARGRRLATPPGLDTRPTTEMVKEAVFSMIQFEIEGASVLDLFAGSGQMGIEALSRGAQSCVFVDSARACQEVLRQNLDATGFRGSGRVVGSDAAAYLRGRSADFDIAFLDPPYRAGLLQGILPGLADAMRPGGIILCETAAAEDMPSQAGEFLKYREYRYGKIKITQYRQPGGGED